MLSDGFSPSAGFYSMQQDAARRLDRMEQRARLAVEQDGSIVSEVQADRDGPAEDRGGRNSPDREPLRQDRPEPLRRDRQGLSRQAADSPAARTDGGDMLERLFLLALIYLLAREKRDPCLIAALVYLAL